VLFWPGQRASAGLRRSDPGAKAKLATASAGADKAAKGDPRADKSQQIRYGKGCKIRL